MGDIKRKGSAEFPPCSLQDEALISRLAPHIIRLVEEAIQNELQRDEYLTTAQVARMLNTTPTKVRWMVQDGTLPVIRDSRNQNWWRFSRKSVERVMAKLERRKLAK